MLPPILTGLALILLALWLPEEVTPIPAPEARAPVILTPGNADARVVEGFDVLKASKQVVEGAVARLRFSGVAVQPGPLGSFTIAPATGAGSSFQTADSPAARFPTSGKPLTLSVQFNSSDNPYASGTETRFGGEGDEAWRLASRVQQHLVGGLREVLAYDDYSRGAIEQMEAESAPGKPAGLEPEAPWVTAYPLFATNPRERSLLEWPETLDLFSMALANALYDYMSPLFPTPPRTAAEGWRSSAPWQLVSPQLVTRGADRAARVALTFDGGASSAPTPAILDALREAGVHATVFLTADFVERNPELVVQMARDGHEFGNHSSSHPDMTKLSSQAIMAELERLEAAVQALTGKSTRPWFRPPFGAYDDRLVKIAAQQGYYTVLWTADSADWRPELAPSVIQNRLLTYAAPGAILIEHLGSSQSAQVLPEVLRRLKQQGLQFGTLSEVMGHFD